MTLDYEGTFVTCFDDMRCCFDGDSFLFTKLISTSYPGLGLVNGTFEVGFVFKATTFFTVWVGCDAFGGKLGCPRLFAACAKNGDAVGTFGLAF